MENELIGEYTSNADLVNGFIASAFVPIYARGAAWASWRGRRFLDGGLSDNVPTPFDDVPALVLNPYMWRDPGDGNGGFPFVRANATWADEMFALGRADAEAHHDELAAVLPLKEGVAAAAPTASPQSS